MKTQLIRFLTALAICVSVHRAAAQGTAFTYQGRLNINGSPANGSYDLSFSIYNAPIGPLALAGPLTNSATAVTNGLFTVRLDFGSNVFAGQICFMQINVESNGVGPYVPLSPRQQLTPTPYAIYSENAGEAYSVISNGVSVAQLNTLDAPASGEVLTYNGTSLVWTNPPSGGSSGWSLTGNSGAGAFLGTTNNNPLNLVADSIPAGTFWPFPDGNVSVALGPDNYFTTSGSGGNFMAGGGVSGLPNIIYTDYSSIGGGFNNQISSGSPESVIAGGSYQRISGSGASTISGGGFNIISNSSGGTIPGGQNNLVTGADGFAAGYFAQAINPGAFVWADSSSQTPFSSTADYQFSVRALGGVRIVTGGSGLSGLTLDGHQVLTTASGGGGSNAPLTITMVQTTNSGTDSSAIGYQNTASGDYATVAGGVQNTASGAGGFVGGGGYDGLNYGANSAFYAASAVVGGFGNTAEAYYAIIGGGYSNTASSYGSFVGGGFHNTASGGTAIVGGGLDNTAGNIYATVGGGQANTASGIGSFVGGGGYNGITTAGNSAIGAASTVCGGWGNSALNEYATVGGGYGNIASYGTVPGGSNNAAYGSGSFAAGRNAYAGFDGSFVWGDGSSEFFSPGANRFDVLSSGGALFHTGGGYGLAINNNGTVGINTAAPQQALEVNGYYAQIDGGLAADGNGLIDAYIGGDGGGSDVQVGSMNPNITAVGFWNQTAQAYMHIYCSSITILGGADLAEPFQISAADKEAPQGAVVVIDQENPGHLKISDQAYDRRVAGVVSGANGINPGIQMQQQGLLDGGKNVALTGRVYVQADATGGPIKPGDLLTTSATPGHAMKVSDHTKAQGAILGKAMTGLKDGKGMVLVLVTLQ